MSNVTLKVNAKMHTLDIDPSTPLLYILRNDLDLHGPRFGCGLGQCGACAVIINGVATRSCITPVSSVRGEVTTLEGLSPKGTLHPVQQAWIEEQAPQCGFCQHGMMIKATELLESNPKPTLVQIKEAFTTSGPSPNLCRCGTHVAIIEAVQHAATSMAQGR